MNSLAFQGFFCDYFREVFPYPNILNFALFQLIWWSAVGGAREGRDWVGPVVFLAVFPLHLYFARRLRREVLLTAAAGILGLVFDSVQRNWGGIDFAPRGSWGLAPWWIVVLWMDFAILVNHSLSWFKSRPFWMILLGAVGGPLSYWAGARLGVVNFRAPLTLSLGSVILEWAIAVPFLFWFNRQWAENANPSRS